MTSEECEKAYVDLIVTREVIKEAIKKSGNSFNPLGIFDKATNVFARLIREHFNNPPLEYEELEPFMWIWDKQVGEYHQVRCIYEDEDGKEIEFYEPHYTDTTDFEKNRFFRKRVEE